MVSMVAAAFLPACDAADDLAPVGQMSRYSMQHDGLEREYFVYLPPAYGHGAVCPVVFFLHGYGGSATGTEAETTNGLNRYAADYGFIVVYPQSTWFMSDGRSAESWEVSSWNHVSGKSDRGPEGPLCTADATRFPCPPECPDCGRCSWHSCNDDTGFLKRLFVTISERFETDRSRYYLTGFSNGSMMAQHIACEASDWFAAVALVGGRVEPGYQCAPTKSLPLLQLNGGRDETVPIGGKASASGFFYATTEATALQWRRGTGCGEEPQPWSSALVEARGLRCTASCAGSNKESIDCLWPEGDHHWPGYPQGHGSNGYCVTALQRQSMPAQTLCVPPDTDVDVWGSRLVLDFFASHSLD
jgi:polyhydroxybutyrate depolymerase